VELQRIFGASTRHHRRAAHMTQDELAERVEVSAETIGKIERGVAAPSFDTVERIAVALDVHPSVLFGVGEDAAPKGQRGHILVRIHAILSEMNDDQMARAAKILDAFLGR
jgi:transcriptional regulator with XRE-family HTH domain